MKKPKIDVVRSKDGKYQAIEIHGEGPNPWASESSVVDQVITVATLRGRGLKELAKAWGKAAKSLRSMLATAEQHAADLGGLEPLKLYLVEVEEFPGCVWWVAARSMGEAIDVSRVEGSHPLDRVLCREIKREHEPVALSGPREVAGQDPWEIVRSVADARARVIGWVDL